MSRIYRSPTQHISFGHHTLSAGQLHNDALLNAASTQATDLNAIAQFSISGLFGKMARLGVLSLGARSIAGSSFFFNSLSHLASVATEAGCLVGMSHGEASLHEFTKHFVNLATFKFFGNVSHGLNSPLQHFSQSTAMLAASQISASLGLIENSQENIFQQFLTANISTFQMNLGNQLLAKMTGHYIQRCEQLLEGRTHAFTESSPVHANNLLPRMNEVSDSSPDELLLRARELANDIVWISQTSSGAGTYESLEELAVITLTMPKETRHLSEVIAHLNRSIESYYQRSRKSDPDSTHSQVVEALRRIPDCANVENINSTRNSLLNIARYANSPVLQMRALETFMDPELLYPSHEGSRVSIHEWSIAIELLAQQTRELHPTPRMLGLFKACLYHPQRIQPRDLSLQGKIRDIFGNLSLNAPDAEARLNSAQLYIEQIRHHPDSVELFLTPLELELLHFPELISETARTLARTLPGAHLRARQRILLWLDDNAEKIDEASARRIFTGVLHATSKDPDNYDMMEAFYSDRYSLYGRNFLAHCVRKGFHPAPHLMTRALTFHSLGLKDMGDSITDIPLFMDLFPLPEAAARPPLKIVGGVLPEPLSIHEVLSRHRISRNGEILIHGRSLAYLLEEGNLLVCKVQNPGENLQDLYRESLWYQRLAPLGLRSSHPRPMLDDQGRPLITQMRDGKMAIVFVAPRNYYQYLDEARSSDAEFRRGLLDAIHDIALLSRHDVYHLVPGKLFHNQEDSAANRYTGDRGRYVVFPELVFKRILGGRSGMGRLDDWAHALEHGNMGVTGLRDFQELASFEEIVFQVSKYCPELKEIADSNDAKLIRASLLANALLVANLYVGQRMAKQIESRGLETWNDAAMIGSAADLLRDIHATFYGARRSISFERARRRIHGHAHWTMLANQMAFYMSPAHANYVQAGRDPKNLPKGIYPPNLYIGSFGAYRPGTFSNEFGFIGPLGEVEKRSLGPVNGQNPILELRKAILAALY